MHVKLNDMKEKNKNLEAEKREGQSQLKEITNRLNKATRANINLTETVTNRRYKVKANQPDLINLRNKVRKLENYQLRFKADLEACMPFITDPKIFTRRIITLKSRYIDDAEKVRMDKNTEAGYKHAVACLAKKVGFCEKIQQHQSSEVKNLQETLLDSQMQLSRTRGNYVKLLNEKIMEIHKLRKQLKEKNQLLEKVTKPSTQKVKSWVNKKFLQTAQAAPEVEDETPSLYPDDWQPPGLPDEELTPSVPPCDLISSAQQPGPCFVNDPLPIKGYAKPNEDDGLPPVDI